MGFAPGQSGNPRGRPKGARNLKPSLAQREAEQLAAEAAATRNGNYPRVDPLDFASAIVSNEKLPLQLRLQAAAIEVQYRHARIAPRPPSTPRVNLPTAKSIAQATANIARLGGLAAAGKIARDEALDLIACQRAFIEAQAETDTERRLEAIEQLLRQHPQLTAIDLTVVDGLPVMPSHEDLIMPPLPRRLKSGNSHGDDNGGATP